VVYGGDVVSLEELAPPYALTRAPQGAMRVDRRSRIHRILGLHRVGGVLE